MANIDAPFKTSQNSLVRLLFTIVLLLLLSPLKLQANEVGTIRLAVTNIQSPKGTLSFSIDIEAQLKLPDQHKKDTSTAKKFQSDWRKNLLKYLSLTACTQVSSHWNKKRIYPTRMSGIFKIECPPRKGIIPGKAYTQERDIKIALKSTPTVNDIHLSIGTSLQVLYTSKNGRYVPQKIYMNWQEITL